MLAYGRHLAYGEDTGLPGASYLWKETRSSPLHDGKSHAGNWHRSHDRYWPGLAISASVLRGDVSGKRPLGQGDSMCDGLGRSLPGLAEAPKDSPV